MSVCASQYGVSVTKYDRRGFKPRPRQLLLTNTFAVLVDRTKIKQRIDYPSLRGETQPGDEYVKILSIVFADLIII